MIARTESPARAQGRQDFRNGVDGDRNPYRQATENAAEWDAGWDEEFNRWSEHRAA